MPDDLEIPTLCGTGANLLLSVVDLIHQSVPKTVWETERLRKVFGNRTVPMILADGDVMAFGPCPDRTLVASAVLQRHGIRPTIIYHERRVPGFTPSTAHIAMEISVDGRTWMMDFGSRESRLIEGEYYFNPEIEETLALERFNLLDMDVDLMSVTPNQMFGMVATENIDMEHKYDYYEKQSRRYSGQILEDRLALDKTHSVYYEL
ncbi:hypothetical protein [Streptomyces leeuwenhoekii]|uniref:Uncharacterized protein n=1 Tax=Streptomyces leeuwenhoekii TaxID=1437453 RepID=A0A0F7VN06_STRLW|nr:hypothetical protein [Streptomyces leeuwenhoekii]CQR59583.1 Hypothetical Protein FRAAL [Streptomyces leeuwenhoekii]